MNPFTPNQLQAIESIDHACVVTAGPGAGKTLVLVERVLEILRQRAGSLDQIVAITFTNKAAAEMKEKIRAGLAALAGSEDPHPGPRHWDDLRRRLDEAAISTIHGFCAGMLRSHPVEVAVDPQFAILSEYETQILLQEAVEGVVNGLLDQSDRTGIRLVAWRGRMKLIEELAELYSTTRSHGFSPDDIERLTLSHLSTEQDYRGALAELDRTVRGLFALDKLPPHTSQQIETLRETWTDVRPLIPGDPRTGDAQVFEGCLEKLLKAKVSKRAQAVKELAGELEGRIADLREIYHDISCMSTLQGVVDIIRRIDTRYREVKADRNGLDFEDLQLKTRDLLRDHPGLARQYAERYRFILVDEFQDTNALQKDILELLWGSRQGEGARPEVDQELGTSLFIVGDQKQSIYNFRGAAVEVFSEAADDLKTRGAAEIVLEKNFRSTESLVQFHREFFSRLMNRPPSSRLPEPGQLGYVEFIPTDSHKGPSPHPPVELILDVGEHIQSVEKGREVEATTIAGRISEMVQTGECLVSDGSGRWHPIHYGDIAILFRALTDIKIYERALRRNGIPYYIMAGRGFYEREEIQDLVSLLRFLENWTDEIALVSALRSPLFGLSDETLYWLRHAAEQRSDGPPDHHPILTSLWNHREIGGISPQQSPLVEQAAHILGCLLDLRHRIPLDGLLEEGLNATHFEAIQSTFFDGHQRVANIHKLLELARGFDALGPHFLSDFIQFVRQFSELETRESEALLEGGSEDAVQVMTIHKAKGLEFPVVIVPDLGRQSRSTIGHLAFDRASGIGMKEPDPAGQPHDTRLRRRVEEQIKWREFFENQRLLFVAVTRAVDYLILTGAVPKLRSETGRKDNGPLGPSTPTPGTWLDSLCEILEIRDPQQLPEIHEWNGLLFRTSSQKRRILPSSQTPRPIIDRYPETLLGAIIPDSQLPEMTEEDDRTFASVMQLSEPPPIGPSVALQPIAVTRLLSFARCQLQYYYESVLGLPPSDEYEAPVGGSEMLESITDHFSAAERGRLVHRFIERFDGSEPWDAVLRQLAQEEVVWPDPVDGQTARDQMFCDLTPMVENYLKSGLWFEIERILWGGKPGSVHSEVAFIAHGGPVTLRGRMDKVIVNGLGEATIVDFKTNRISSDQVPAVAAEYELQMRLYAWAARRALNYKIVAAELHFLEPNIRYEVDRTQLEEIEIDREVRDLCRGIVHVRRIEDAIARPSPDRCRRCRCFSFCPSREA